MRMIHKITVFLARFFISAVFLAGAIHKILNWHESEKLLMGILTDWQTNIAFSEAMQNGFAQLIPWTPVILIAATLFELIGGLLVLLGVKEKLGATLLILFLIPATILMHAFWFAEPNAKELQTIMFLKNLAILGGLFLILLYGAQPKSKGDSFSPINIG